MKTGVVVAPFDVPDGREGDMHGAVAGLDLDVIGPRLREGFGLSGIQGCLGVLLCLLLQAVAGEFPVPGRQGANRNAIRDNGNEQRPHGPLIQFHFAETVQGIVQMRR